jgi:fibronectin type 3 domain-containing protein
MNNGGSVLPKNVKLLSATNVEDGIEITWQASTRATKYKIYRKGPNDKSWVGLDTVDGSKTSYVDESAKSGVKYTYTVKACNIVGWGTCDQKGIAKTRLDEPDFDVKATTSGVNVSWKKVAGATEYKVYRKAAGESKWTTLKTTASTSFTDKTAKNGKTYTYGVKALKGKVTSSYDTEKITFVSAPKLASAKNAKDGVEIKWNAVSGATKYRVYRKASGEKSWTKLADTTKLAYTDKTAKSGKTYSYTVKAYKDSAASAVNSTGLSVKRLEAPELIKAKKVTSGIGIYWEETTGAKEYRVYRRTSGGSWTMIGTTENVKYTDKTAKSGVTYIYTVKAVSGKSISTYDSKGVSAKR